MSSVLKKYINYYNNFSCIGSECSLTCCNTWKIDIDENTFNQYQALDKQHDTQIVQNLTLQDGPNPAFIKLNEAGICPFLAENSLCELVCTHGPDILSNACQDFPRLKLERPLENSEYHIMEVGCPEVVRQALFSTDKLHYLDAETTTDTKPLADNAGQSEFKQATYAINRLFIQLIQLDTLSIDQRLAATLHFCDRIDQSDFKNNPQATQHIQSEMLEVITGAAQLPKAFTANRAMQFHIQNCILENYVTTLSQTKESPLKAATYNLILGHFDGLGIASFGEIDQQQHGNNYAVAYETYTAPFLNTNPQFTENFFAHHMLSYVFPFDGKEDSTAVSRFLRIAAIYMLTVGFTTGHAARNGGIDGGLLADTVAVLYRSFIRNEAALDYIEKVCEVYEVDSVEAIYSMVA